MRDDALAVEVDEERALAAHGLRHQRLLARGAGAEEQRGGVELHELEVGDGRAGAQGERDAVAGRHRGVGGAGEDLSHAAGREHDGPGVDRADAVLACPRRARAASRPAARPSAVRSRSSTSACSTSRTSSAGPHGRDERALHLGAGGVTAGVHDPVAVMPALARQRQTAGGIAVERRAERDQLAQARRALGAQHPHGVDVAQPDAGDERVAAGAPRGCRRARARRPPRPAPSGSSRRRRAPW